MGLIPLICKCFNPRARVGRDPGCQAELDRLKLFQSTRPCRARQLCQVLPALNISFQSTRPCRARRMAFCHLLIKKLVPLIRLILHIRHKNIVDHEIYILTRYY